MGAPPMHVHNSFCAEKGYQLKEEIGAGVQGKVYLAVTEEGAAKVIKISSAPLPLGLKLLKKLPLHPNILPLEQVYVNPNDFSTCCVMPHIEGAIDLLQYLEVKNSAFSSEQILFIFKQLCDAVTHLHRFGLVHRDLKLENILIQPTTLHCWLIDFGFATKVNTQRPTFCGSVNYVSPELVRCYLKQKTKNKPLALIADIDLTKVDIWALGVILFTLCSTFFPFGGEELDSVFERILNSKLD